MVFRTPWRAVAVAAGVFALLACAGDLAAQKRARAVFNETAHDFGKVKQGDVLTYEFVFKNQGDATLEVNRVETSCGCTAALVSAKKVKPGEEGRIKATFDSHGYSGRVTKYVLFSSNDSARPRLELSLSADIETPPQPRIELDKYNVDLGLSLVGEAPSGKFRIKNVGERELKVEIDQPEIQFLSRGKPVSFPLSIAAGQSVEVEFRFPPQAVAGTLRDYILVKSNDQVRATQSVFVSRYVMTKQELRKVFEKYRSILDDRR
jgi:hypothetical protein